MSEFSLTTLFVVPVGNTLPTTGGTQAQTAGQFSVRKDEARTIATNANIATAAFIQFFQGREASIGAVLGSKPSDKIKASKVKKWYKVVGHGTALPQISEISAFTAQCGEDVTVTLRGHSKFLDTISFNGLTRSVTVKAPCCDCGADPCTEVDNEALVDLIIAKLADMAAVQNGTSSLTISTFFTFVKSGTGAAAKIIVTSKALTAYGQPCDIAADPYIYDRIWFNVWVTKGPAVTVDFDVEDICDTTATVTLVQASKMPTGTSAEIKQMEKNYYSYQTSFKSLYRVAGYNPMFESFVTDGTVYDTYVIQFDEYSQNNTYMANIPLDERVILAIPAGAGAVIETMLTTYLGAPVDSSAA